ncbi:hypothetical protein N311_01414, partial [Apaloderma vittatum]
PAALAGKAPPAAVEAADAREAEAPSVDGHSLGDSLGAEDAANGSRGGVAH